MALEHIGSIRSNVHRFIFSKNPKKWTGLPQLNFLTFHEATLPETNIAPRNGWLEYDPFLSGRPIFRGYVSFREGNKNTKKTEFHFHASLVSNM